MPICEAGERGGLPFFFMKIVDGGPLLRDRAGAPAEAGKPFARRVAEVMTVVARAVHRAHQRGTLHRDLKPATSWSPGAQPRAAASGLPCRLEGDRGTTPTGAIVGTPAYMAPEQALGEKGLTVAAVVRALGVILYELPTGLPPFHADSPVGTLQGVVGEGPPAPRHLDDRIRDLETVTLKCLDKEPPRRSESAQALADDLQRHLAGKPLLARPVTLQERALKWSSRHLPGRP